MEERDETHWPCDRCGLYVLLRSLYRWSGSGRRVRDLVYERHATFQAACENSGKVLSSEVVP